MTKIAAIQMCSSHIVDENLKTAQKLIREAAQQGAKLVVLPEMFAIMGQATEDKVLLQEPLGHGKIQSFLAEISKEQQIWLVAGTIPIACADKNKVRAACLVFDDNGNRVARYDKIHLFDVVLSEHETYKESNTTEPGHEIVSLHTPFGRLGLAVCYDVRFPELFRCLLKQGVEIITLPAAFTVVTGQAHWELLARSRAVDNFCYLIGACQGGVHSNGRKTYGHSMIIAPWGNIIEEIPGTDEGIIYADIDLDNVYAARKSIPIEHHQKISIEKNVLKN